MMERKKRRMKRTIKGKGKNEKDKMKRAQQNKKRVQICTSTLDESQCKIYGV